MRHRRTPKNLGAITGGGGTPGARQIVSSSIHRGRQTNGPLDAAILKAAHARGEGVTGQIQDEIAQRLKVAADEVAISLDNLTRFRLMTKPTGSRNFYVSPFGREFLRAISDKRPVASGDANICADRASACAGKCSR